MTKEEVLSVIEDVIADIEITGAIGGVEEYILARLAAIVEREFRHDDFNPTAKDKDGR